MREVDREDGNLCGETKKEVNSTSSKRDESPTYVCSRVPMVRDNDHRSSFCGYNFLRFLSIKRVNFAFVPERLEGESS
jgi:hypothetical protein